MFTYITGISGTVGTAFADQLDNVSGIDRNEESVARFKMSRPDIDVGVGDFADVDFGVTKADVLIHLAAMKHVDLCETNVNECVMNNVIKTHKLFLNAHRNGVKIVFMSTDKACEPISVYGFSKAIGERMALEYGGTVIRSGNILASSGSVLKVWDDSIVKLEPIKVTHKDMVRFFISPENLVRGVWRRYLDGEKLIIPKMDKEIKLMDLLAEKLESAGYTVDNYPGGIEFIGLRPGEKLSEKLEWA